MNHYRTERVGRSLRIMETEYDSRYLEKTESLFAQANGTFGLRGSLEITAIRGQKGLYIAGLYGETEGEVSELVNGPDFLTFNFIVDDYPVTLNECNIQSFKRELDLETGEIITQISLKLENEKIMHFFSRRFASFGNPRLFCHEVSITIDKAANVRVESGIDGRITNSGISFLSSPTVKVIDDKVMSYKASTGTNSLLINTRIRPFDEERSHFFVRKRSIFQEKTWGAEAHITYTFTKVTHVALDEEVLMDSHMLEQLSMNYEELFSQHMVVYEKIVDSSRITIKGTTLREEASIALSRYHLLGMGNTENSDVSVGAKGLTGEGYKGHIFWDTEIYLLPFYTFVNPSIARNLLIYRAKRIEGARMKARNYGYKGTMYPWESALSGMEETPLYSALNIHTGKVTKVWSGIKEHHVTADIIYGLWQYYTATGDEEFLLDYGYEMIFEAADFWSSRADWDTKKRMYVILDVIGPDEYTEHVDNNAFTNYLAHFVISLALDSLETIRRKHPEIFEEMNRRFCLDVHEKNWKKVGNNLYLPKGNAQGIVPQDDTFLAKVPLANIAKYRESEVRQMILKDYSRDEVVNMQVLKQADIVMLFNLLPDYFDAEITRKNIEYYEARTIHDSSLSYCAHAEASARIQDRNNALRFFQKSLEIDFNDNFKDASEGIHAAAQGGIWKSLIFGFAGVRIKQNSLLFNPNLPDDWMLMTFELTVQGVKLKVALNNNIVILEKTIKDESELNVEVNKQRYVLKGSKLEIKLEGRQDVRTDI